MQESRPPQLICNNDEYREKSHHAKCDQRCEDHNVLVRRKCLGYGINTQQHDGRKHEQAFVGRSEKSKDIDKGLEYRIRRPLGHQNLRTTALRSPKQIPPHDTKNPDATDRHQRNGYPSPFRSPVVLELNIEDVQDRRRQDSACRLYGNRQAGNYREKDQPAPCSELALGESQVSGEQDKE